MICIAEDCEREARYKEAKLCQKHYFRKMRTGTTDARKPKEKYNHTYGYILIRSNGHPLAQKSNGYLVYEHRAVIYARYKDNLPGCYFCGMDLTWSNCHIDHIDENRENNNIKNLRPTCSACNTQRGKKNKNYNSKYFIEWKGERKSLSEWERDGRVKTTRQNIVSRIKKGWSIEEALFKPSQKKYKKNNKEYWVEKHGID